MTELREENKNKREKLGKGFLACVCCLAIKKTNKEDVLALLERSVLTWNRYKSRRTNEIKYGVMLERFREALPAT